MINIEIDNLLFEKMIETYLISGNLYDDLRAKQMEDIVNKYNLNINVASIIKGALDDFQRLKDLMSGAC